ncbi:MAG: protein kinase, partial [Deltaproteobacteria bacterium]|nr:protein kinase [Deltaproteobacteria bacterium]
MERERDTQPDEPLEMGGLILQPGVNIGGYVFLREIGSGGMARVLLAKAPNGTLVALKVLRRSRFKTGLARFRREFRALSKTNHPNVIHVDAYGDLHGHPYIAMEYIDGPDLHALIRSFRAWEPEKRWRRCEEILVDLCRALAAIHRRGLVHRDLKPSNVLITKEGVCKLTDFGIVKDIDPSHEAQQSTTLVGTWAYCSPEQITGQPIDHRSDLYSLGVILFAMLTGKRPFVANDMAGYLALHRDRPAPATRDVNRAIPEHLDEICRRLLQKSPRDRYQSAQEILYRLEAEERVPVPSSADGWEPPLVGRDLELESISNAVAGLTGNRGGLLLLEGEDGSGKSRLLDIVVDRARNLGVPFHREEFAAEIPVFQVLLRILRDTARELGTRAPSDSEKHLADFAAGGDLRGDQRHALGDSALEIMSYALEEGPRMWILDDLHDAAPRELELLAHLLRSLVQKSSMPFLVVGTLRPKANAAADRLATGEDLGFEPQEIAIGPLAREDISSILLGLVGETPAAALLAQRLHRETEGNAYFISEFLRSLMASNAIARQPGGKHVLALSPEEISTDHLEIPPGVRQMMKARLEAVLPGDRTVLEVLAVGGRDVELDVLLEVLDLAEETALASLDRLLASGIVRERQSGEQILHAVSHRKFADVVYRDLAPERRASLHRKVAAALELHYASNPAALEV